MKRTFILSLAIGFAASVMGCGDSAKVKKTAKSFMSRYGKEK